MLGISASETGFDAGVHVIQVALTPVFLLSAISVLLSVYSTRHSYVTQLAGQILARAHENPAVATGHLNKQLTILRWRSITLDIAVIFGILGGAATCSAALLLFLAELNNSKTVTFLFGFFGSALLLTIASLGAFAIEMMMAGHGLRSKMIEERHFVDLQAEHNTKT